MRKTSAAKNSPRAKAPPPRQHRRPARIEPIYRFARANPDFQDVATSLAAHPPEKREALFARLLARVEEEGAEGSWTEPLESLRDPVILAELLDALSPKVAPRPIRAKFRHRHPRPGKR